MAIQWHPLLAQFLRQDYGDRLEIQEEVNLGDAPIRADLVLIRRDPKVGLPYPLNDLGAITLVEFKGPKETAGQKALTRLEIYGLLYYERTKLTRRRDLTLWLVASKFSRTVSQPEGTYLADARGVGPGVQGGSLDQFPTCLVNLNGLPVSRETLPLVMVSRGPQERVLAEYVLDHRQEHPDYLRLLMEMHQKAFEEVIKMRELTLEELGVEDPDKYIADVIKLVGEQRILQKLREEQGEEQVLRDLVNQIGLPKTRRLLDQLEKPSTKKLRRS
jgi:hypothetical protein